MSTPAVYPVSEEIHDTLITKFQENDDSRELMDFIVLSVIKLLILNFYNLDPDSNSLTPQTGGGEFWFYASDGDYLLEAGISTQAVQRVQFMVEYWKSHTRDMMDSMKKLFLVHMNWLQLNSDEIRVSTDTASTVTSFASWLTALIPSKTGDYTRLQTQVVKFVDQEMQLNYFVSERELREVVVSLVSIQGTKIVLQNTAAERFLKGEGPFDFEDRVMQEYAHLSQLDRALVFALTHTFRQIYLKTFPTIESIFQPLREMSKMKRGEYNQYYQNYENLIFFLFILICFMLVVGVLQRFREASYWSRKGYKFLRYLKNRKKKKKSKTKNK